MVANNRENLLAAVNALTQAPDAPELFKAIKELVPVAERLGAQFAGDREVLNPLVNLAVSDPAKFHKIVELVESKREAAGLSPLQEPEDTGFDKTDYMRDFMAQKRERERRAAEIENLMRPDTAQLRGRARTDFMQMQASRWKAQRDTMLATLKARLGRKLRREETKELLQQFWAKVDKELDDLEELARAEKAGKVQRR